MVVGRPPVGRKPDTGMSLFGFSHSDTKGRTVSIYRHGCWDPGGQKMATTKNIGIANRMDTSCYNIRFPIFVSNFTVYVWHPGGWMMKTEDTKKSKFIAIGDDDIYTIFQLHSSVYVWDPDAYPIDQPYSIRRIHLAKTFQTRAKPSNNIEPYVLQEISVALDELSDSENL
jgi:hypothetical protein